MSQAQGTEIVMQASARINCVLAASSSVLLTSELMFYKTMLVTIPLLALGSIRRFFHDPQICIHGFHEVAKRITSHREALDYLLPLGDPATQVARMVKNLLVMQEATVRPLGWEDPPWRREWQPTPVFLPGESHGQRSLAGYSPWGRTESHMTE